jgi:hypothetical protein
MNKQFEIIKSEIEIGNCFILSLMFFGFYFATYNNFFALLGFIFLIFLAIAMNKSKEIDNGKNKHNKRNK